MNTSKNQHRTSGISSMMWAESSALAGRRSRKYSAPARAHMNPLLRGEEGEAIGIETVDLLRSVDLGNLRTLSVAKALDLLLSRLFDGELDAGPFYANGLLEPELHVALDGSSSWRLAARYVIEFGLDCRFETLLNVIAAESKHSITGTICVPPEDCWLWGCMQEEAYGEQAQDQQLPGSTPKVKRTPLRRAAAREYEAWTRNNPIRQRLFRFGPHELL